MYDDFMFYNFYTLFTKTVELNMPDIVLNIYVKLSIIDSTAMRSTEVPLSLFYIADNLSNTQSGSSLSLASAATNEADSVNSGGACSQR